MFNRSNQKRRLKLLLLLSCQINPSLQRMKLQSSMNLSQIINSKALTPLPNIMTSSRLQTTPILLTSLGKTTITSNRTALIPTKAIIINRITNRTTSKTTPTVIPKITNRAITTVVTKTISKSIRITIKITSSRITRAIPIRLKTLLMARIRDIRSRISSTGLSIILGTIREECSSSSRINLNSNGEVVIYIT